VRLAQWLITLLFAFFLIQVGGSLLADMPSLTTAPQRQTFLHTPSIAALEASLQPLQAEQRDLQERLNELRGRQDLARQAYESDKASFDTWRSTRSATGQEGQNSEVIARARQLDNQLQLQRQLRGEQRALEQRLSGVRARTTPIEGQLAARKDQAERRYQQARERAEWVVFGLRLVLVGPLLAVALWQFRRYRQSEQWPFVWGILIFGLFTFFVELVPYLPSFGGYIRYGVGALLTVVAGRALIRWLRAYLWRKQREQTAPPEERQRGIRDEKALQTLGRNQCPSCERRLTSHTSAPDGALPNFCMHCGLTLQLDCPRCQCHHLAFFPFCPSCGLARGNAPSG
jgi:hypothetical protein